MKTIIIILGVIIGFMGFTAASEYQGWTKSTYKKQAYLVRMGYTTGYANTIINECKAIDGKLGFNGKSGKWDGDMLSADKCIAWTSSVCKQESSAGTDNRTSVMCGVKAMSGIDDYHFQLKDFVGRYTRYWYKHTLSTQWTQISKFCTEEPGMAYNTGCPNWEKGVQTYVNQYYTFIAPHLLAYNK